MSHRSHHLHKIGKFSTIGLGVSTMVGSGWLFAPYYAAKAAGPGAMLSWCLGAFITAIMGFLLTEIAIRHAKRGLFTRLITLSHNQHYGFVTAISNWLVGLMVIPSEAIATIQYLSTLYPRLTPYIFHEHHFTYLGLLVIMLLLLLFLLFNYWGIKLLARFNNVMAVIKIVIPILSATVILLTAFHGKNYTAYRHSLLPYGISSVFSTVVTSGIFYSFFGFQIIVSFASELKNPEKNIPITLITCISIVLIIYLFLQFSFIGALPTTMIQNGWAHIHFTSPLVQLALLLGLNGLAILLYFDATISPPGTGIAYLGASTRMLTAMAEHKQMPPFFAKKGAHNISRRSMLFTFALCLLLILFFRNWQQIAVLTTTFILISCVALPIAYTKLSFGYLTPQNKIKLKIGRILAFFIFLFLSYLFTFVPVANLVILFLLHSVLFFIYAFIHNRHQLGKMRITFLNTWWIFLYMLFLMLYTLIINTATNNHPHNIIATSIYLIVAGMLFFGLVSQKTIPLGGD